MFDRIMHISPVHRSFLTPSLTCSYRNIQAATAMANRPTINMALGVVTIHSSKVSEVPLTGPMGSEAHRAHLPHTQCPLLGSKRIACRSARAMCHGTFLVGGPTMGRILPLPQFARPVHHAHGQSKAGGKRCQSNNHHWGQGALISRSAFWPPFRHERKSIIQPVPPCEAT